MDYSELMTERQVLDQQPMAVRHEEPDQLEQVSHRKIMACGPLATKRGQT